MRVYNVAVCVLGVCDRHNARCTLPQTGCDLAVSLYVMKDSHTEVKPRLSNCKP